MDGTDGADGAAGFPRELRSLEKAKPAAGMTSYPRHIPRLVWYAESRTKYTGEGPDGGSLHRGGGGGAAGPARGYDPSPPRVGTEKSLTK
jgi:hypothetical protein